MQFPPPRLKVGRQLVTAKNKAAGVDSHNTVSLIEKTNDIFILNTLIMPPTSVPTVVSGATCAKG